MFIVHPVPRVVSALNVYSSLRSGMRQVYVCATTATTGSCFYIPGMSLWGISGEWTLSVCDVVHPLKVVHVYIGQGG